MNALSSQNSFLNPSLALLLQSLDASWLNASGAVLPMPDHPVAVAALRELLLRPQALGPGEGALLTGIDLAPGALLVRDGAGHGGSLHLSVAAWHTLMAGWPHMDEAGLALLARAAPQAMAAGAEVVALALSEAEWASVRQTAAPLLGARNLIEGEATEVTDLTSLRAALSVAKATPGLVIADGSPFDDSNRFGHFAVAVNTESAPGIYLGRALFETVRALWPEAVAEGAELRLTDADGAPIGVVRLAPEALGGRTPADWVADLVQRGIVDAGQVVYTAMPQAPTSFADFNDAVRRDAFTADFVTPEPGAIVFTAETRQAWLGAAWRAATPALTEAAAWLDAARQALEGAPVGGGWMALGDEAAASLTDPARWPADHALLQASLLLQGNIRRTISGQAKGLLWCRFAASSSHSMCCMTKRRRHRVAAGC